MKTKTKISFTKASAKDAAKVTVRLAQLPEEFRHLDKDSAIVLTFTGNSKVLFIVNRTKQTAATNAWPFAHPFVGDPVVHTVVAVDHAVILD